VQTLGALVTRTTGERQTDKEREKERERERERERKAVHDRDGTAASSTAGSTAAKRGRDWGRGKRSSSKLDACGTPTLVIKKRDEYHIGLQRSWWGHHNKLLWRELKYSQTYR